MQNNAIERSDADAEYSLVIVDDDSVFTALLARQLRRSDERFVIFHDSKKALAYLEQASPSALLIDLRMPGLNGLELLEAIGYDSDSSSPTVFVCSSCLPPQDIQAAIKALGATLITKDDLLQKDVLQDLLSNQKSTDSILSPVLSVASPIAGG